ncbi:MAG: D-hexose-6-phosphate mutarotase [Hyphomicrobiaceae bacterium]|nr:D-hexose-6-phosphate mutarotase [Hyphomicrobiaceae bacterium]
MDSDVEQLNATFGRPGAVSFAEHELGGPVAQLVTAHASAIVAIHGAHVLSFLPKEGREVLWMSPQARIAPGQGIRGGIPVCWPWFATHASDTSKPDHGFVRKAPWRVVRSAAENGSAEIELTFAAMGEYAALWPGKAELKVVVSLSDRLRVELATQNLGDATIELTEALHTYFAIGNIADVTVRGLEGRSYRDKLQDYAVITQQGAITFAGEVDRIYEDTLDDVVIEDPGHGRKIRVAKAGSTSTVVWNPWIEKSQRLSDMPAQGYLGMVCVETANAGGDVVTLEPRDTHRLTTVLSVEPL